MLDRYGVQAESRFVDVPSVGGRAHALIAGQGRPVVMISGIGTPGAMWAPLMPELHGLRLIAVDLPGYGLTDTPRALADDIRQSAVRFLTGVLDGLALDRAAFVGNSLTSQHSCFGERTTPLDPEQWVNSWYERCRPQSCMSSEEATPHG